MDTKAILLKLWRHYHYRWQVFRWPELRLGLEAEQLGHVAWRDCLAARPSPTQGQDGQGRRAGGRACVRAAGQRSCHLSARQGHDSQCTAFPQPRKLLTWQLLRNRAVSLSIYYIIYFLLFISFFLHSCCWSSWFRQRGAPCQMVCVCVFMQSPAGDCGEPPAGADEAEGRAG